MTSLTQSPQRAAIYVRVSKPQQAKSKDWGRPAERDRQETSPETQEAECRQYAAEHGYLVDDAHVYREVHTRAELWERDVLTRLRRAIRLRLTDVVIVHAIDRLSGDPVHLAVILSEAEYAGVTVEFVTEPLDESPEGQLIRFIRGYAAKVEHAKIRERTQRGIAARIRAGKPLPGARVLYGYQWNADRTGYEPDPVTSAVVRRIFTEALAGRTLRAIARELTADGIPTPTGKPAWVYTSVVKVLKHPSYAGRGVALRYRSTKIKGQGWRARVRPTEEQVPLPDGTIPALVAPEVFDAVQERLRSNQLRSARNNRDPEAALLRGGYVRCGYCGHTMPMVRLSNGNYIYRCAIGGSGEPVKCKYHGIMTHVLDAAVWGKVEAILTKPEMVATELERMLADDPTEVDLDAVDKALVSITRQQRNLVDQLANVSGGVAELVTQKLSGLEAERQQLQSERDAILRRRQSWIAARQRVADLETWCRTVATKLGEFTYQQKRDALDALGVRVKVYRQDAPDRVVVEGSIPLDAPIVYPTPARSAR
jgi:site-specific DNA recombinase